MKPFRFATLLVPLLLLAGCDRTPVEPAAPLAVPDAPNALLVPTGNRFTQVSAGGYFNCAVKSDGSLACWGDDTSGQSTPPPPSPACCRPPPSPRPAPSWWGRRSR